MRTLKRAKLGGRQIKVLEVLRQLAGKDWTYREIADAAGIKEASDALLVIQRLRDRGLVEKRVLMVEREVIVPTDYVHPAAGV